MAKSLSLFLILMVLLSGCSTQPEPEPQIKPVWILNPNIGSKSGAVGVAGRTYDQKISTKRKLAITRALDELSLQRGVKIELSIDKREVVSNNSAQTAMNSQSNYTASTSITAHIEDVWEDKSTNELYIWMILD